MRILPFVLAIVLVGPGCAYVGQVAFEEKRDSLDHDKDGAPFGGPEGERDCDDFNELRAPNNPEIPYDGWDNDCDGDDLVDADGDGYPGILREDYLAANPEAKWPDGLREELDCADDVAIWPNAADIFPGNINDIAYDGIDADCGGDNDFDSDGDGFIPDEYIAAFDQYVLDWGYDTLLSQAGDCNDLRADAYPGGADIWYDGHDDDCAGDNDFDADNDCYMWDVDTNSVKYQDFLETYHPTGAPWLTANGGLCDEVWDDCLDQENPAAYAFVQPSTVYPGAPDTYYDGIDSDCACDNDFDADGDGVMPDGYDNEFAEFNIDWGCNLVELAGDCNDNDADTAPGNLERLGDGADSDCDLDPNTTPFGFGTTDWYNPRPPRIERTADHYAILASAQVMHPSNITPVTKLDSGVLLAFDPAAGHLAQPAIGPQFWQGTGTAVPLGFAIDAEWNDVDGFLNAGTNYYYNGNGYVMVKGINYNGTTNTYYGSSTEWSTISGEYAGLSYDVMTDDLGMVWGLTCGTQTLHVVRGDNDSTTNPPDSAVLTPTSGIQSGVCFWDGTPDLASPDVANLVTCDPGVDCTTYQFDASAVDGLALAPTNPWAGRQIEYGQLRRNWHILIETNAQGAVLEGPGGVEDDFVVLPTWNVHSVDAYWRDTDGTPGDDTVYVAAIAEALPDDGLGKRVVLGWGPIGGPLTEQILPFSHPTRPDLELDGVGIYADDDRLVIGVSALNSNTPLPTDCWIDDTTYLTNGHAPADADYCLSDSVGWVFFGW